MPEERQFWDWFQVNEAKYFFLNQINDDDEKEQLLDELLSHLHEYCDQLFFEIGGYPDQKQDLIITAEGDTDFFSAVEMLVKEAPSLEYWNVLAFKPAREDYIIEYEGIEVNPGQMYFIPLSNDKEPKKIGVRVYIDNYSKAQKKTFLSATLLVLDNVLGEKSHALDIGYVDIAILPSGSERAELIELIKLPRYIAWKKSQ